MKYIVALLLTAVSIPAFAQPLWQQKVDTKIDVSLNDNNHTLSAYEEINYTNNSPDTLKFIYIHLWPNAYKNDHTPFAQQQDRNGHTAFYFSKQSDRGYIDSLQFQVDGKNAEFFSTEDQPDIARLDLPHPLLPGKNIKITTPFKVKIPIVFSRMGHTGQAYFISQWFPKPAVYDQKGWHPIPYLDEGEFFSEYGSYDVHITLPENYVLMATGNCMDEKENARLDKMAKDSLPSDTLYKNWFPPSSPALKTVYYHEDNVHDFAWFADKRWVVMKDTVYSPGNNQLVTTWSAFLPAYKKSWIKSNEYLKETIKHYGKWVGPYPYKTVKAVLGDMHAGGGMEYPTITIIDKAASQSLKTVVIHEAGHNWFYGLLGSMERDHAWMDEGLNTFYEKKTSKDISTPKDSTKAKKSRVSMKLTNIDEELIYYELAATHNDQAIDQTSNNFVFVNYGMDVYYKTNLMLKWLESYMGEANFEAGMKEYFDTWHFHHPYPDDFMAIMQKHSTKNIGWFYDPILKSDQPIDFRITKAHINGSNTDITVQNNTGVKSPVLIDAVVNDSITVSSWTQPFTNTTTISLPTTNWTSLKVDDIIPDYKSTNDIYRRNALFHRFNFRIKPIFGLNLSDKEKMFIAPAFGVNHYDGFMAGILLHDFSIPENKFKFVLAPMYGFGSNSLVGAGSVGYQWYPENFFKEILLQTDAKSFHYADALNNPNNTHYLSYTKIAPSINFTINEHNPLSTVVKTLTFKAYSINEQVQSPNSDSSLWALKTQQKTYGQLYYHHVNKRTFNPFSYSVEGQIGAEFAKVNLEGNIRIDYFAKNKALYLRGYIGKFFAISTDPAIYSRYELNATYSGINDYLYDGTYIGRTAQSGTGAAQISMQEGGFKIPVFNSVGRSDNWMATINISTDLPKTKLPIRLFLDAGLIPNATPSFTNSGSTTLLYDGGIEIHLINNIMSVYIPIIKSIDFDNYLTNTYGKSKAFQRGLSFTLQFQNFNWLKSPLKMVKLG